MPAGKSGLGHLATDCRRRFFPAAVVGFVRTVDVVVARHAGDDAVVLAVVAAEPFAEKFFPAVAVLWHRGIGIGFPQRGNVRRQLFVRGVDAGRRGEEVPCHAGFLGGQQEMRVDEDVQHARGLVRFDVAHPAHIGREIVDFGRALHGTPAGGEFAQIGLNRFDAGGRRLVPVGERLQIDGPHAPALSGEVGCQMTTDEPTGAANNNQRGGHACVIGGRCFARPSTQEDSCAARWPAATDVRRTRDCCAGSAGRAFVVRCPAGTATRARGAASSAAPAV